MLTNRFEKPKYHRVVGQTKTAGFEIGGRKTFPISVDDAWKLITSNEGIRIWLGEPSQLQLAKGETYTMKDGAEGEIRVLQPGVNIRLTWLPRAWQKASTIQIRTIRSGENTVISFHQEGLASEKEREEMQRRWQNVLEELQSLLRAKGMI